MKMQTEVHRKPYLALHTSVASTTTTTATTVDTREERVRERHSTRCPVRPHAVKLDTVLSLLHA